MSQKKLSIAQDDKGKEGKLIVKNDEKIFHSDLDQVQDRLRVTHKKKFRRIL